MNYFAFLSLISAVIMFYLGIFVLQRKPNEKLNRIFFVMALFISLNAFAEFCYRSAESGQVAYYWMKVDSIWAIPIVLILQFAIEFTSPQVTRSVRSWLLIQGYSFAFFFFIIELFTGLMWIKPIVTPWGWAPLILIDNVPNILLTIWVPVMAIIILHLFWRTHKKSDNWRQKQQAKSLFFGILFPYLVSSVTDLIIPFFMPDFPSLFNIAYIVAGGFVAYAILKYGLFILRPTEIAEKLLSKISDAVLLVDPSEKVEALNQAFVALSGYEKKYVQGKSVQNMFTRKNESASNKGREDVSPIFEPTVIQNLEINLKTNSGNNRPVMISKSPLEGRGGNIEGFIYFITDLTTRQEAQINTQVHDAIQVADNVNTELLTWASHEIKTPLVAILGWSELLYKAKKEGKDLDKLFDEGDFLAMWRSATRLEDIVKNFLDAGLIQKRGLILHLTSTNISDLITECIKIVEASMAEKKIQFKNSNAPVWAEVDKAKLRQTIINLLSNAIKYSPLSAVVEVILTQQTRDVRPGFELQVVDKGYGFTPEELKHVFEPFVRAFTEQEEKKYIPGVGLGLYISKNIVELHGGQIALVSEGKGKGTTIRIWIPEKASNVQP